MKLKYFGHAAFLIFSEDNLKIFVDPWVTNPLSPITSVDEIEEKVDYILITHDHSDHFGEALEIAEKHNATIIGVYETVKDLSVSVIPANIGGKIKLSDTTYVVLTKAEHSSIKGTPVGYIITSGNKTVYHAGDTGVFMDMKLYGEMYNINVALLPIGGTFTMDTESVIKALELLHPEKFIPMHYNTFPAIKVSREKLDEMVKKAESLGVECIILEPGESYEF